MGRRRRGRRRRVYRPKKRIPNIFSCPYCGRKSVGVSINKKEGTVVVKCGACSLGEGYSFEYDENLKPVDYYSQFVDLFYEGKLTVPAPSVSLKSIPSTSTETAEASE